MQIAPDPDQAKRSEKLFAKLLPVRSGVGATRLLDIVQSPHLQYPYRHAVGVFPGAARHDHAHAGMPLPDLA